MLSNIKVGQVMYRVYNHYSTKDKFIRRVEVTKVGNKYVYLNNNHKPHGRFEFEAGGRNNRYDHLKPVEGPNFQDYVYFSEIEAHTQEIAIPFAKKIVQTEINEGFWRMASVEKIATLLKCVNDITGVNKKGLDNEVPQL